MKSKRDIWRDAKRRWVSKHPEEVMAARLRRKLSGKNYAPVRDDRRRGYERDLYRKLRTLAIEKLGGECKKCGIRDGRVLEIDHINQTQNGVSIPELRKKTSCKGTDNTVHRKIIRGEITGDELQVLCANCHAIKTWENDERAYKKTAEEVAVQKKVQPNLFDVA
jgi:hypothetical protein